MTNVTDMLPLPPSSTIIIEYAGQDDQTMTVNVFVNDKKMALQGCESTDSCLASAWLTNMNTTFNNQSMPNVTKFCTETPASNPNLKFI